MTFALCCAGPWRSARLTRTECVGARPGASCCVLRSPCVDTHGFLSPLRTDTPTAKSWATRAACGPRPPARRPHTTRRRTRASPPPCPSPPAAACSHRRPLRSPRRRRLRRRCLATRTCRRRRPCQLTHRLTSRRQPRRKPPRRPARPRSPLQDADTRAQVRSASSSLPSSPNRLTPA